MPANAPSGDLLKHLGEPVVVILPRFDKRAGVLRGVIETGDLITLEIALNAPIRLPADVHRHNDDPEEPPHNYPGEETTR